MRRVSLNAGVSLVEIIIASAIIATMLVSAIGVAAKSIAISRESVHAYTAATLLEEGAEAVRIIRDGGWSAMSSLTAGTTYYPVFSSSTHMWSLSTTPSTTDIFTRTVTIATVNRNSSTQDIATSGTADTNTKLVTVTVTWPEGGTTITKTLSFYILNIF